MVSSMTSRIADAVGPDRCSWRRRRLPVMIGMVYGSHSAMLVALLDLVAVLDQQARAVGHAVARHDHGPESSISTISQLRPMTTAPAFASPRPCVQVLDLDGRVEGRLDARLLGAALGRAADVEGAHGELGARLADRLGGDDADRLAHVDDGAAREVAAVALDADAVCGSRRSAPSGSAPPRRRRCRSPRPLPRPSACPP